MILMAQLDVAGIGESYISFSRTRASGLHH